MTQSLINDINFFANSCPFRKELHRKRFLITGGSGLIGSIMIQCLLTLKEDIHIIAPVRNAAKLRELLKNNDTSFVDIIECDLLSFEYNQIKNVDYIIHCAAPTASSFFISQPIETTEVISLLSLKLLQYAKNQSVKSFVFVSSMEVYGSGLDNEDITEDKLGYCSLTDVRSCYPIAKRYIEHLCYLFAKEYGLHTTIVRPAQTTGAGVDPKDNRIINQFVKLAATHQDIVLHSQGLSTRPSCYSIDCILGILYVLFKGQSGQAYNIANPQTYMSVKELAEFIRDNFAPDINVRYELNDNMGYAPTSKLKLNKEKLEALGWQPEYNIHKMIKQLISYYHEIG